MGMNLKVLKMMNKQNNYNYMITNPYQIPLFSVCIISTISVQWRLLFKVSQENGDGLLLTAIHLIMLLASAKLSIK